MVMSDAADIMVEVFRELQRSGEISPQIRVGSDFEEMTIDQLGLDSVGVITLLAALEERTGAVLTEVDLHADMQIGDFVRLIVERSA